MKTLFAVIFAGLLAGCAVPSEVMITSEHERGYYVDPVNPTIVIDHDYRHRPRYFRVHPEFYRYKHVDNVVH